MRADTVINFEDVYGVDASVHTQPSAEFETSNTSVSHVATRSLSVRGERSLEIPSRTFQFQVLSLVDKRNSSYWSWEV